jgi:hypothetical protein
VENTEGVSERDTEAMAEDTCVGSGWVEEFGHWVVGMKDETRWGRWWRTDASDH